MGSLRSLAALAAFAGMVATTDAQIRQAGQPASNWARLEADVPEYMLDRPDIEGMLLEDEVSNGFPLRYGAVMNADFDLNTSGRWEVSDLDGSLVWRLKVSSPEAYTLGIVFTDFWLPSGGELFLYNADKSEVHGAYTEQNNNIDNVLGIEPVTGDTVIIEYVQQAWVEEIPRLTVGEVVHDYRNVNEILGNGGSGGGLAGGCGLVGINCPEGAPYQVIKRAAIRTLSGGALCSASILNNTAQDGTPYMLTANHCGQASSATLSFNFENSGCSIAGGTAQSMSGIQLLASSNNFDSRLYRLNNNIPTNYNPYFAGWNRTNIAPAPAISIGHGGGDAKQIAIDSNGASFSGGDWAFFANTGTIIGGNSGGPLFDGNDRVIGPACCVTNFVCGSQTTFYGRLSNFWSSGNLAQWLDPIGSGATVLDGLDPSNPPTAPVLTSTVPTSMPSFQGGLLTINGTSLSSATGVSIGGQPLTEGIQPGQYRLVNNATIEILDPISPSEGPTPVTVTNAIGTSNAVFVDFQPISAPILTTPVLSFPSLPFTWNYAGVPNSVYLLNFQLNPATAPLGGFNILAMPGLLFSGTLTGGGTGSNTVGAAPSLGAITVYFQVLTFDPNDSSFTGASNISDVVVI